MRPPRLARTILAFASFSLCAWAALGAQGGDPAARRAMLVRGADSVKGLPFFPPNAIAALAGAYSLSGPASPGAAAEPPGKGEAAVWYSRESLVFGLAWKRADASLGASSGEAAYSLARDSGLVLALKVGKYALFFELPPGDDARSRAFVQAFDRKFRVFFESAASDAELSFPAYVDY
jgi:hypothetical protein